MTQQPERSHWDAYAARFKLVGQPLRPSVDDVTHLRDSVSRLLAPRSAGERALLLGVTPEIAAIDWQLPLDLLAIDKSSGMIDAIWPGDTVSRRARVGDWLEIDEPDGAFALAMGDGVFSLLEYPSGYAALGAALSRLVRGGGLFCVRLFCRPLRCESVDAIFAALDAGRIGNFHVFKWRLAMALQGEATSGVRLADIWNVFCARAESIAALAAKSGFPEPEVATIEAYREVRDRYSFSTEREVVESLAPSFELIETWRPPYELGDRCPHLTFRRRG